MASKTLKRRTPSKKPRPTANTRTSSKPRSRRSFVIDVHAHWTSPPEVVAFTRGRTVDSSIPPGAPEHLAALDRKWTAEFQHKQNDLDARLREMDRTGVDMQVVTTGILRTCTYFAPPEVGLKMDRLINERTAEMVAKAPGRLVGLGSVPLQAPELAAQELERCLKELGLKGVQISSQVNDMELGDARLRPFWAAAERLGAAVFLHPAGVLGERYNRWQLWNSLGQNIEEALAMASLFYEGTLDAFPRLKLCIAHGGGFLPYAAGRVDRNYEDKAWTRMNMTKPPSRYLRENFYYDTCVYNPEMLDTLVDKVGAARIMLGSDFPVGEQDPVGFVRNCRKLSSADKERILGGNAAQWLGL